MAAQTDIYDSVEHGYAVSEGGVKIHYVRIGPPSAPLVVLIHGFPDFWYSWRDQDAGALRWLSDGGDRSARL